MLNIKIKFSREDSNLQQQPDKLVSPPDYVLIALFTTVFFLPLGLPALVYAVRSKAEFQNGQHELAWKHSKTSLIIITAALSLVAVALAASVVILLMSKAQYVETYSPRLRKTTTTLQTSTTLHPAEFFLLSLNVSKNNYAENQTETDQKEYQNESFNVSKNNYPENKTETDQKEYQNETESENETKHIENKLLENESTVVFSHEVQVGLESKGFAASDKLLRTGTTHLVPQREGLTKDSSPQNDLPNT